MIATLARLLQAVERRRRPDGRGVTAADGERPSPNGRILLLAGQGFALGLTLAWITIPASTIFLTAYGADLLPVTYIGAACAGALASASLIGAFRRRPLAEVATRVLVGVVGGAAGGVVDARSQRDGAGSPSPCWSWCPSSCRWASSSSSARPACCSTSGRSRRSYARVVAGFALGVVSGGLAGPPLLDVLGGTEDLVAAAAAATALLLALVVTARRRYPTSSRSIEHDAVASERPTLRTLTRNRYVMLIVAFQMLSAVESQWLDFLVFDRAAQRYADSTELARFVSQFAAIAYGVDIVFLLLLAGLLLRRFGLRYGLTANSLGVLTVLGGIVVATTLRGSGATIVFALVVAARVVDLTFSDGASRTSLSAAYQAVPNHLRAVSQATVEGLAVPVAIGASGVVLLVVDAAGFTDGLLLPVLTGVVVLAWVVVATVAVSQLRRRTCWPACAAARSTPPCSPSMTRAAWS